MRLLARLFLFATLALATLAANAEERVTYLVPNAQGSPVAAMDAQGNVLWRESYAPWGERRTKPAANDAKTAYTGKPEDPATGLVYMGARWYDPDAGRFTGIDPQGFKDGNPQSFGRYVYANNAPYRYADPDGESPVDLGFLAYDVATLVAASSSGVGVGAAAIDVAIDLVGVASPVPGTGQAIKAVKAADKVSGAIHAAEAGAKAGSPGKGDKLYRVYGGDSKADGASWTRVDPSTVSDYRAAAGLPSGGASGVRNTGQYVIEGTLEKPGAVVGSRAAKALDGHPGGLDEHIIPNAISSGAVRVDRVSGVNPEF